METLSQRDASVHRPVYWLGVEEARIQRPLSVGQACVLNILVLAPSGAAALGTEAPFPPVTGAQGEGGEVQTEWFVMSKGVKLRMLSHVPQLGDGMMRFPLLLPPAKDSEIVRIQVEPGDPADGEVFIVVYQGRDLFGTFTIDLFAPAEEEGGS